MISPGNKSKLCINDIEEIDLSNSAISKKEEHVEGA